MQFIELYNLGVTDLDELEKKLESPKSSIYSYIHRAHKEGKIVKVPRKKKEKKKLNDEKFASRIVQNPKIGFWEKLLDKMKR